MPVQPPIPIPFPPFTTNPIQISIDQIKFNDVDLGTHFPSVWFDSVVSDKLRVDFTVHNDSKDTPIPYAVVTGDILDGDVKIMSSGYGKRDFFSVSSAIGPLGVGEKATGFLLMKWDDNWISKQHAVGSCQLQLQFWGQQNEYHPDRGDQLFTIAIPDPHPNEPDKPPPDPNAPFVPPPVVHKSTDTVIFRPLSFAIISVDVYPGCGRNGDFLRWPELLPRIFLNGKEIPVLPTSPRSGVGCHDYNVSDGVSITLSWSVANGGFPAADNHPGSIAEVTITGPGILGTLTVQPTQVVAQENGVISAGEVSPPIQIGGMNVVDAIKPFTLRIKGQCGQVKASAVLLPETSVPISPVAIFQTWDGNQVFNSSAAARSGRIIGGFAGEAGSHFWPTSLDELVAVIQNGEKLGRHVRAVGSAWSFSDVAITPDYIVHMTSLNRTLGWPGIQLPNCPPIMSNALALTARGRGLYHVEAGITIRDLYTRLNNQKRADEIVGSLPESTAALAAANGDNPFNCGQVDARPQILNSLLIWNHPQWALPTMGGSGGQTLGGAISTSVHGGDFKLAPLPDMVQAVHLVGPGGKQYWIERSTPITDKQTLAKIYPEIDEQNIIYDDVWFNAILVSMGCMGIIYSLVIEVRDQYGLEEVRAKSTWSTVQPLLANGSLFASLPPWLTANRQDNNQDFVPRFLEIDVNPYPEDDNDHVCVVRSRREIGKDGLPKLPRSTQIDEGRINNIVQNDDFAIYARGFFEKLLGPSEAGSIELAKIVNAAEGHNNVTLVHDLSKEILEQYGLDPPWINVKGLSYEIMDTYDYSGDKPTGAPQEGQLRVLSLEIAFDASNNSYLSSIDELFTIIRDAIKVKKFIAGLCWIRFAGPSDAYLAMQQTNRTCHIEFDLLKYADSTWDLLNKIAMTTVAFGGRLHWGLNATQFCSSAYPNQQKWKLVWTALTNNGTVLTFNNDFSKRCGLTP